MALFVRSVTRELAAQIPPKEIPMWQQILSVVVGFGLAGLFGWCLVQEYLISRHEPSHRGHITLLVVGVMFGVFFALPKVAFPVVQQVIVLGRDTNIPWLRRKDDAAASREHLLRGNGQRDD